MSQARGCSSERAPALARHSVTRVPIVVINAHNRCNCRCVMCDIWKITESRPLLPSDLEPHLVSFRALGVEWVVFTGGEPLMNPDLPLLCRMLKEQGIKLTLLSTGILLEKHAADVACMFDEVIVSLDGPPDAHDQIRRVHGAFEMLALGVRALHALTPSLPVRGRTTVQKANHLRMRETVQTAKLLGLTSISFLAADLTSTAFNRQLQWPAARQSDVGLSKEELSELESEIETLIRECGDDIRAGFIAESPAKLRRIADHFRSHLGLSASVSPLCNAPWVSAVIESDGAVRPCFFHAPIGNIHDTAFEKIINGDTALRFRSELDVESNPICQRCVCSLYFRD